MALTIPPAHFAYAGGLFALSTVWLLATTMAVIAIRNRLPGGAASWHRLGR